jgi:hypothetical protein
MDAGQISCLCAERAEALCLLLLSGGKRKGNHWLAGSVAGEAGKSLSVILSGDRAGRWKDFATGDHGDLIDLWRLARNTDSKTAIQECRDWLGVPDTFTPVRRTPRVAPSSPQPHSFAWTELQRMMRRGLGSDFLALAALRKIPRTEGLQLASDAGQLWFGDVYDDGIHRPGWIITDSSRRAAQARRMDGENWAGIDSKNKTIAGTDPRWPVGIVEAAAYPEIALVEGGPDFLAAWYFIWLAEAVDRIRPVAMFGASNPIHADALPLFAGKTIWLHPHNDKGAGQAATERWSAQLLQAGAADIQRMDFGIGMVKDLCDVAAGGLEG